MKILFAEFLMKIVCHTKGLTAAIFEEILLEALILCVTVEQCHQRNWDLKLECFYVSYQVLVLLKKCRISSLTWLQVEAAAKVGVVLKATSHGGCGMLEKEQELAVE